jgi:membrane dipeptidase
MRDQGSRHFERTGGPAGDDRGPSCRLSRRRFLEHGACAVASGIVGMTASAGATAVDPDRLAAARAFLAKTLSVDMHSHAALTSDAWGPLAPLAAPMREGGMKAIVLAFSSDKPLQSTGGGRIVVTRAPAAGELQDYARDMFERLALLIQEQALGVVIDAAGLEAARTGKPAVIVSVEGADFLEGSLARLEDVFSGHRLRHLQLTHYRVNELGDIQTVAPVHGGLTPFGADVVRACNRLGVVVDVAHGSHDLVRQAAAVTTKPLVLSHSAIVSFPTSLSRSISVEHARIVAETGGVVGIWALLTMFRDKTALVDGMKQMVDAIGIDHVGLGSDMLGMPSRAFRSYTELPALAAVMLGQGFAGEEVEKILGGNYARVFAKTVG